jgi:hypothetical protein
MSTNPVLYGWNIDGNYNDNKQCLIVLNSGGRNDSNTYLWRGQKNMSATNTSYYAKTSPQTYIFTPTDVIYNKSILPETQ